MRKLFEKWRISLGAFFLAAALLFIFYPAPAGAAYSSNLIPIMTSNTTPSGIVSASSEYPGRPAWLAFDDDPGSFWATAKVEYDGWLQYEFTAPKAITKFSFYTIESADVPNYTHLYFGIILDVTLEAYDDNANSWVELLNAGVPQPSYDEITRHDFEVNNQKEYKRYRVSFHGWDQWSQVAIFGLEMYENIGPPYYPPASINAAAGNTQATVIWEAVEGATGYNVKRSVHSGGPYTTIGSNLTETSYTDTNLKNNTTYYYVVSAIGPNGETTNSNEKSVTPVLDKPNLVSTYNVKKVSLTWNKIDHATSYKIKRASTAGGTNTVVGTTTDSLKFTDTNVAVGGTYYYIVTPVDAGGDGPNSNEVAVTITDEDVTPPPVGEGDTQLTIYLLNGTTKTYDLSSEGSRAFIDWYQAKGNGSGNPFYIFTVNEATGDFTQLKEYIPFDKILYFQVRE